MEHKRGATMLTVVTEREATRAGAGAEFTREAIIATAKAEDKPESNGVAEALRCYNAMLRVLGCGIDYDKVGTHKGDTTYYDVQAYITTVGMNAAAVPFESACIDDGERYMDMAH